MEQRLKTFSPWAASPSAKAAVAKRKEQAVTAATLLNVEIMARIIQRPLRLTTKRACFEMRQNARPGPGTLPISSWP
ncbi:exported hypothetical protein [Agrobacterium deltaense NCPPB 1641]|uniref:Uncharacterized protein n=1 Tax=Agrobacterium deltaense NCPPB 1641 TaxID=1183425 RepID=A0A1S7TTS9_9HYPH|nr:exported hypothetical protein [Agrobacterium deltaense NCPPB 1641]